MGALTGPIFYGIVKYGDITMLIEKYNIDDFILELNKLQGIKSKYYELLYNVSEKHLGETRHETALRYIKQSENQCNPPQCDALS